MKVLKYIAIAAIAAMITTPTVRAASTADVVFLVDESGSMSGEHAWLGGVGVSLDTALINAGVTGNRFGLVGFGGASTHLPGHGHSVGGGQFGTAAQFATATSSLLLNGGTEDGWSAIDYAINNYSFRANAAVNFILVTDEDRDNAGNALTYASVLNSLTSNNILLNAVVDVNLRTAGNLVALGLSSSSSYRADGSGGFIAEAGGSAISGFGTTITNYHSMALASGGASWDLDILRLGGSNALSFTKAFVDVKVQEIVQQPPTRGVPDGGSTLAFLACAMGGLAALRRKLAA